MNIMSLSKNSLNPTGGGSTGMVQLTLPPETWLMHSQSDYSGGCCGIHGRYDLDNFWYWCGLPSRAFCYTGGGTITKGGKLRCVVGVRE
jgi:hypothetical protein